MHYSVCVDIWLFTGQTCSGLIDFMAAALEKGAVNGSDPGLCVAGAVGKDEKEALIRFGDMAKHHVSSKDQAYDLARHLGVHLSEHGGIGEGVIGALAGIGLRLSGNDGRYRGWYHLGRPGDLIRVGDLCAHSFIDKVVTKKGQILHPDTMVHVGSEKTKTVRLGFSRVVVVTENENRSDGNSRFCIITKQEAKHY